MIIRTYRMALITLTAMTLLIGGCSDDSMPSDPTPPSGSTEICPDLNGQELIDCIVLNYTPGTTFPYQEAREHIYGNVDIWDDGLVHTIYTNYTIIIDANASSPQSVANSKMVETEHVFPQSMGAGQEPAKGDMFHLFPCRNNVNRARSNNPFAEINDASTEDWYYMDQKLTNIPTQNIDDYTEGTDDEWEPREEVKGDIARAVFYFYTIHNNVANIAFYESMKNDLLVWHNLDPADDRERQRNERIRALQGNDNPYIIDSGLAERLVDN